MARLIEDTTLRDRVHVFKDREEAGRALSLMLSSYRETQGQPPGLNFNPIADKTASAKAFRQGLSL